MKSKTTYWVATTFVACIMTVSAGLLLRMPRP